MVIARQLSAAGIMIDNQITYWEEMFMKKKALSVILAAAMVGTMMVGCGSSSSSSTDTSTDAAAEETTEAAEETTEAAEETTEEAAEETTEAAEESTETAAADGDYIIGDYATVPAKPDTGDMSSNEWLLNQDDKLSLSGVVSSHMDSRADVEKAVDSLAAKADQDTIKIACLMASQGTQFFTTLSAAVEERCEEYGYDVTMFDANFDLGTQQDQYEQVLAADYDYIICNAVDIDAESDLYRQSVEKGIPVVVTGPTAGQDDYQNLTTILSGSWAAGYATGVYTCDYIAKTRGLDGTALKWGAVVDKMGDADSESRPNGWIAGYLYEYDQLTGQGAYENKWDAAATAYEIWCDLRDSGSHTIDGIVELTQVVCTNEIATSAAQPKCAELLSAHPDLDIAFVETDSFGLAMVTELYQEGFTPGEDMLVVYAADGTGDLCEAIKNGEVLCIGVNVPTYNGYGSVDLCYDILNNVMDCNDLPENSFTPTYCVTPENVDEVYTEGNLYADPMEWQIQTTDEYNEANA